MGAIAYFRSVGRRWWVLLAALLTAGAALASVLGRGILDVSVWLGIAWWLWALVLGLVLSVALNLAQYLAWREADAARLVNSKKTGERLADAPPNPPGPPPVRTTFSLNPLPQLLRASEPRRTLASAYLHPAYLLISVQNEGLALLERALCKVKLVAPDKRELGGYAAWSVQPGDKFVAGGPLEVEISAGSERLAVLAVAYQGATGTWFRIHRDELSPTHHFGPAIDSDLDSNPDEIGDRCTAEITFHAAGYTPLLRRLSLRVRQQPNAIGEAEFEPDTT